MAGEHRADKAYDCRIPNEFDVIVCGGGMAGIGAAMLAARHGARTLLVERYGRLGGMAVNAMVCEMLRSTQNAPLLDEFFGQKHARPFDFELYDLELAEKVEKEGASILLHAFVADALKDGNCVKGVRLATKEGFRDVKAKAVIDATGDGDVAFFAGAEYEMGRESDGLMQPASIMFRIGDVDPEPAHLAFRGGGWRTFRFPDGQTWQQKVYAAMKSGELPRNVGTIRFYLTNRPDEEIINATQINYVDCTKSEDLTISELQCRRQMLPILDFIKKHAPGYENARLTGAPAVIGVRETRRILGTAYLTRDDLVKGRTFTDAVVKDMCHALDIHNPDGPGQHVGRTEETPHGKDERRGVYDIPYGCLVPRDLDGLLVAGRCISGSHEAMSSYRMIGTCYAMGTAAGIAAALSISSNKRLRDIDIREVQKRLGY